MLADPISQNRLVLSPQASTTPAETHAAMVVSQASFSNVRFSAGFETVEQLRTGSAPNPWESAWAIFGYTDDEHFYYVAFKPNGWELGKVDPAYPGAQRYLATGSTPTCAVGTEHSFDIRQDGNVITVWLDGALLTTYTDRERPYLEGKVGFYTEDATVAFDNVSGSIRDDFESYGDVRFGDGATLGSLWETPYVGYGYAAVHGEEAAGAGAAPSVSGTEGDDVLVGTAGDDYIDGRGGADEMSARAGNDTYKVDNSADRIVEGVDRGSDTALSTADWYRLGANVENMTLVGSAGQKAVGNGLDNELVSNYTRGHLRGGGGDDVLVSGSGSDRLTGGEGADRFVFTQAAAEDGTLRQIRDFEPGVDTIDVRAILQAYGGANPIADGHVQLKANSLGGTTVVVDGQRLTRIDNVAPDEIDVEDLLWQ